LHVHPAGVAYGEGEATWKDGRLHLTLPARQGIILAD
jgi:hypothetical protein